MRKLGIFLAVLAFCLCLPVFEVRAYVSSAGEAVVEVESGRVLYSSDGEKRLPMASTTKILTAIIIIEDCPLDDVVSVPSEAVGIEGSSIYLVEGEKLTVRDLLYGLMLRSGNDCAVALALYHSGSIEAFAGVMNERARAMGARDSGFSDPHGLPAQGHYTTALDLAAIAAYALRNPVFREIVSSRSYTIADGGCGYMRVLQNKNKMLVRYEGADGVKTGYTKEAGRCLVSSATRDGMRVVCVVLNSPEMYERSAELLDRAFAEFKMCTLFKSSGFSLRLPTDCKGKYVTARCESDFRYPLRADEEEKVTIRREVPERVLLPVREGQSVGELRIYLENQLLFSQKIVSILSVKKSYLDIVREIV